jgi:hypothetical protein
LRQRPKSPMAGTGSSQCPEPGAAPVVPLCRILARCVHARLAPARPRRPPLCCRLCITKLPAASEHLVSATL